MRKALRNTGKPSPDSPRYRESPADWTHRHNVREYGAYDLYNIFLSAILADMRAYAYDRVIRGEA